MDHIAIMSKQFGDLIPKILDGRKKIESRWSKNKIVPWDRVRPSDTIYFKNSGRLVTAKATVSKILQFDSLDPAKVKKILDKWPLVSYEWAKNKRYCTLIFLKNPQKTIPFKINKTGFGSAAAWLCVEYIEKVKVQ